MSVDAAPTLGEFVEYVGEFARVCGTAECEDVREWKDNASAAIESAFQWAHYVQRTALLLRVADATIIDGSIARWFAEPLSRRQGPSSEIRPMLRTLTVACLLDAPGLLLRTLLHNPDTPGEVVLAALQHAISPDCATPSQAGTAQTEEEQEASVVASLLPAVRSRAELRLVQQMLLGAGSTSTAPGGGDAMRDAAVAAAEHAARGASAPTSALVTGRAVALALAKNASSLPRNSVAAFFAQPNMFEGQPKLLEAVCWLSSGQTRASGGAAEGAADAVLTAAPPSSGEGALQTCSLAALRTAVSAAAGLASVKRDFFRLHPELVAIVCAADAAESDEPRSELDCIELDPRRDEPIREFDPAAQGETLLLDAYCEHLRHTALQLLASEQTAPPPGGAKRLRYVLADDADVASG